MSGNVRRSHHRSSRRDAGEVLRRAALGILMLGVISVLLARLLVPVEAPAPEGWTTVSVGTSGTLWQLALDHPVTGLSTAQTVDLIQRENGLGSGVLYAGQSLRVPAVAEVRTTAVAQR